MATLDDLEAANAVTRIEVGLDDHIQPWRRLYGTPDFIQWLEHTLPALTTTVVGGEIEPIEQVDAIFHEYVSGEPMAADRRFATLSSKPELHVWEMRTLDVRIFGWFIAQDLFVCTYGDHADRIKLMDSYGKYIAQTAYFRNNSMLDEPTCVLSKDYRDVLSDARRLEIGQSRSFHNTRS